MLLDNSNVGVADGNNNAIRSSGKDMRNSKRVSKEKGMQTAEFEGFI